MRCACVFSSGAAAWSKRRCRDPFPYSAPPWVRREVQYAEPIQLPLIAHRRNVSSSARFNKAYPNGADTRRSGTLRRSVRMNGNVPPLLTSTDRYALRFESFDVNEYSVFRR